MLEREMKSCDQVVSVVKWNDVYSVAIRPPKGKAPASKVGERF